MTEVRFCRWRAPQIKKAEITCKLLQAATVYFSVFLLGCCVNLRKIESWNKFFWILGFSTSEKFTIIASLEKRIIQTLVSNRVVKFDLGALVNKQSNSQRKTDTIRFVIKSTYEL